MSTFKNIRSSNSNSTPALLKVLWREGFFSKAKRFSEISDGLASEGHHFPPSSLGVALMRVVRPAGFLARMKINGEWRYIQKHPITSIAGKRIDLFSRYEFHSRIKEVAYQGSV